MLPQLAKAARCARKDAGATTAEVAHEANVDPTTVTRFELASAWPRDPDAMIAAYARAADRTPKEIWRDALNDW